ncbi:rhodanese-like domain-containing protein [Kordia algicida OT-1]|uniref:Rhodanese-like domain protein n=1 Tax=Kordia algicida OT-1 TaxID=391587 RepID=A9DPX3_9FLAO|nr:rhodanese-like domain-containing protein [Kordia algicida]EDP97546.1 rhodanese-like domain protein [Kordia algicida OT-1]
MSFLNSLFGDKSKLSDEIEILDVATFKEAISKKDVQLVDVRTKFEYTSGHIEKAINIDFFDRANFNENFASFDREKPIYLYCRSGNRSQRAAKKLVANGFQKIYDLKGGYKAWK